MCGASGVGDHAASAASFKHAQPTAARFDGTNPDHSIASLVLELELIAIAERHNACLLRVAVIGRRLVLLHTINVQAHETFSPAILVLDSQLARPAQRRRKRSLVATIGVSVPPVRTRSLVAHVAVEPRDLPTFWRSGVARGCPVDLKWPAVCAATTM